ncbi:MAG: hypothetical protein J6M46_04245 [Lachnospiraceae bacterium]|nr:hypothetical protein [Lachnospiraceae bacterium]
MWKDAVWLGVPRQELIDQKIYEGDANGRFVYYRLSFFLRETGDLTADISANSRYRLWVNGVPVLSGPCRSDGFVRYYDTAELGPYLQAGQNVIAAQVLLADSSYCSDGGPGHVDERQPLVSVKPVMAGHAFAMEGRVIGRDGEVLADITTGKADWKLHLDNTFALRKVPGVNENMGALTEEIDFSVTDADWKKADYDDSAYVPGKPLGTAADPFALNFGILPVFYAKERPIPLLFEEPFPLTKELGEPVLGAAEELRIPAGTTCTLLFDAGEHVNVYPRYFLEKGRGSELRITCFEKFVDPDPGAEKELKRDDYVNGVIGEGGQTDIVRLSGGAIIYEPFWYRTLRFLQIEIRTGEEELVFHRPQLRRMGYPLNPGSWIRADQPWIEQLWEMCVRTLQNCMTDAYMDCPFWEQMQYPMDTRLQAMFTYACSTDTQLARKALSDFHDSMTPAGLIQGRAPSNPVQIISTFSLHYIFMIWEYYERTGDESVLKLYRSDVDRILEYYDGKIGADGLVGRIGFWEFVDWQIAWNDTFGEPAATRKGPSTIINLMYGRALLVAAKINEATGRSGLAEEYRARQQAIAARVEELCWNPERGLYREGPAYEEYSQHAQSWAVLNGMKRGEEAAVMMRRTFEEADVLRCYFSTCYELFRACEEAGCYELTAQQMDWWIRLIDEHCTTCPETPAHSRSECHAWSALPMYELIHVLAGVRRKAGCLDIIEVRPHFAEYGLKHLEGEMITEHGPIRFAYTCDCDDTNTDHAAAHGCIVLPEGMSGTLDLPGADPQELVPGENRF